MQESFLIENEWNWYDRFNAIEAGLWGFVAIVIGLKLPLAIGPQKAAAILGCAMFLTFGLSDLLEVGRDGRLPLWLWGLKVACGTGILSARYLWKGWQTFSWTDCEFQFGLFCLIAVVAMVAIQNRVIP